jgi:DNA helicase-2/ATP-dependent DNA helicase PcrA
MARRTSAGDRIVRSDEKRVEVTASPGSGKTHTLVGRVGFLLGNEVPAEKILVLSFSKASVAELRRRIRTGVNGSTSLAADDPSKGVVVQTAHAFALGLIRRAVGDVRVLRDKQATELLLKAIQTARRAVRRGPLWADRPLKVRQRRHRQLGHLRQPAQMKLLSRLFSVAGATKRKLSAVISHDQFADIHGYGKVGAEVKRRYAALKKKRDALDYGDMLADAAEILENDPASVPFTHVLVDEYQDCSAAQVHLLARLAGLDGRSIMVFGDPHQAIFAFAGARYTPLSTVLDGVKKFNLPHSLRLTAQTAALASAVARHSPENAIQTDREGVAPRLLIDESQTAQTERVVHDIKRFIARGTPPEKIVVLARTKALLHPVEQALLAANMQTERKGLKRDLKQLRCVLRLVRVVERCEAARTAVTPEMLRTKLSKLTGVVDDLWQREARALSKVVQIPSLEGRYQLCAKAYLRLMGGVRANPELRADLNRWAPLARGYSNAQKMWNAVRAMKSKGVVTGTIHSAKGCEWDHVLVVGVTDGYLPLYHSRDDPQSLAEERNLLYVAITRARDSIRLCHAPAQHARSRKRFDNVCRFLEARRVRATLRRT